MAKKRNKSAQNNFEQSVEKKSSSMEQLPVYDKAPIPMQHPTEYVPPIVTNPDIMNPLLARARLPGETFQLPSLGIFYTNGELDETVSAGELLVYPMVTMDEIYMKSPDKLLNGTSIIDVFKRCVPQVLRPLDLLARDMDFLLICLRKITYGDEYSFEFTHDCKNAKAHEYTISIDNWMRTTKKIEPAEISKKCEISFNNGQTVTLIPPKYSQVIKLFQNFDKIDDLETNELANDIIESLKSLIFAVDEITDKSLIEGWLKEIPAGYVKKITDQIGKITDWGPDQSVNITCKDCGHEETEVFISLNPISFFS